MYNTYFDRSIEADKTGPVSLDNKQIIVMTLHRYKK